MKEDNIIQVKSFKFAVRAVNAYRYNISTEELQSMYKQLQDIQMYYQLKMASHKILVDDTLRIFFEMIYKNERYIFDELKKRE